MHLLARVRRQVHLAGVLLGAVVALTAATGAAHAAATAADLTLTTPYPAVAVAPGAHVTFDVTVMAPSSERVGLALAGVPDGWKAVIHGGGNVVDAVETGGSSPPTISVDVTVPDTAAGDATLVLTAQAAEGTRRLPLQVRVAPSEAGQVTLTTDFPSLQGPASQTFSFNLTLANRSAQDLTFAVNAQGPDGWTVNATLTGQSQAASAVVKAGQSSGVTVSAQPPSGTTAGTYPIQVVATAGAQEIPGTLQVVITGSYDLAMSTPNQVLSASGSAGSASDLALTVTDDGTSPVTGVKLDATAPTGWKVTFDPPTIASLDPGKTQTVTAHVIPSSDAIAGDYVLSLKASGDKSTRASEDIRFTVETSLVWSIVGIGLIALVIVGLGFVFRRYGRR